MPDKRRGSNIRYRMADIGLAAFSVFFMQSPSFLAHQRALDERHGRSNAHTLFQMSSIPCDNHIRQMLDGVPTDHFDPVFADVAHDVDQRGGFAPMRCLGGRMLVALDGSEHFCSRKISCPRCSTRRRSDGDTESFHSFVGASLVAPGQATVFPLPAEFVRPQDGAAKQDCEPMAARRWLDRFGATYAFLKPVYLGDDLYAHQPMVEAVRAVGGSFIFVCKPASHKTLHEYLTGVEIDSVSETKGAGSAKRIYTYRFMAGVPLRDGKDAIPVNWLEIVIARPNGQVTFKSSFVTDLTVDRDSVAEIAACGRARWKIENETFNVLKNSGYNLEHNFGHGTDTLASLLVVFNLLAFAMHCACDLLVAVWEDARKSRGSRRRFFEHIRTITAYLLFPSWQSLMRTILTGIPPPEPRPTPTS